MAELRDVDLVFIWACEEHYEGVNGVDGLHSTIRSVKVLCELAYTALNGLMRYWLCRKDSMTACLSRRFVSSPTPFTFCLF